MPRPPKYSEDRARRALDALGAGATRRLAAAHAGVTDETLAAWAKRYPDFSLQVRARETESELARVATIQRCSMGGAVITRKTTCTQHPDGTIVTIVDETYAPPDGRLALEVQARLHPREWGRIERVQVNVEARAEALAEELGLPVEVVLAEALRQADLAAAALPAPRRALRAVG